MITKQTLRAAVVIAWIAAFCLGVARGLSGCSTMPIPVPSSVPSTMPSSIPSPTATQGASIDAIINSSACTGMNWSQRGPFSKAVYKGFAETFQKSLCAKRPAWTQPIWDLQHDGFAIYKVPPTLANLYALLLSSAAWESSGNVCENWDSSAGSNRPSSTAEAGILQQSMDLMANGQSLHDVYNEYLAHPERCGFSTFRNSVCTTNTLGSGPGADFQSEMKSCPALAIEQAAIGFRIAIGHWGPARAGKLQFVQSCADMFSAVQKITVCN